jgi:hypothetical protein
MIGEKSAERDRKRNRVTRREFKLNVVGCVWCDDGDLAGMDGDDLGFTST